jgi:hypothetical protein
MLTNTILWNDGEKRSPKLKDMRRVLKMVIEERRQIGLAGDGAGVQALARPT